MGSIARLTVGRVADYIETALDVMLRENKRPQRYRGTAADFSVEAYWTQEKQLTITLNIE